MDESFSSSDSPADDNLEQTELLGSALATEKEMKERQRLVKKTTDSPAPSKKLPDCTR
jgi:hypothetical protein